MNKLAIYILPAVALLASCGGAPTVDQAALDAKVNAKIKMSQEQQKTSCDAMVIQTAQMRADSIKTARTAVIAPIAKPTETVVAAVPIAIKSKNPVPATTNTVVANKKPIVKKEIIAKPKTETEKAKGLFDKTKKNTEKVVKTETDKAKGLFDKTKKNVDKTVKQEGDKVKKQFDKSDKATEKVIKEEEKKVKSMFK
jgi:hypothetical protein